ncbi:MAG: hypothetical protein RLZZ535_360 [Cyanobacteriota bacterium]
MNEPNVKNFWNNFEKRLNNSKLIRYLLLFTLAWAIAQVLAYFETVIVVFILAAILAFILNYPVQWLTRFLPRGLIEQNILTFISKRLTKITIKSIRHFIVTFFSNIDGIKK